MLVKYMSLFRAVARPSACHFRLVRPPTYYLRTTLATQLRTTHSDPPKPPESKDDPKKDDPKSEAKDAQSESKDGYKSESKDALKSESKDAPKSESKDAPKSESKDTPKSDSKYGPGSKAKDAPKGKPKKLILDAWNSGVFKATIVGGGLTLLCFAYSKYSRQKNEEAVFHAIEQGSYPKAKGGLITRKAIIEKLHDIFRIPIEYHLVIGEYGTGKTMALIQAANEIGNGIVYVKGSEDLKKFSNSFANALGWKYEVAVKGIVKDDFDPIHKLDCAMSIFRHSAARYKAKYNKPAVLILDDIGGLAQSHPEVISRLQKIAKDVADNEEFTIVFVASEGTIPALMSSNSAWSRASKFPLLIDDFTENEAFAYLQCILNLKGEKGKEEEEKKEREERARQLYQLFGGRITLLQSYSSQMNMGQSFEDIRQTAFAEADNILRKSKIGHRDEFESIGKEIFKELLSKKDKTITLRDFQGITKDNALADKLLKTNVFSFNMVKGTVTFQSRLIEVYVMEHLEEFGLK